MNVLIPPEFSRIVDSLVSSGDYSTPDAVVCDALLVLQNRNRDRERLQVAVQIGLDQADRGDLKELSVDEVKAAARRKLAT